MADAHGINLAISNPCFELWLALHLRESPGMNHRHDMQALLKALVPGYDKHVDFAVYAPGYPQAVKRAKRLETLANDANSPGHNPTTNVYELTKLILKGRDDEQSEGSTPESSGE